MNLIASLRSLPPKQALALALAEKAKRQRKRNQLSEAAERAVDSYASEAEGPPVPLQVSSVVLDDTHVISQLLTTGKLCAGPSAQHIRYKIYWGGRGAVKSWGMAEALVRLAAAKPLRILCCREFQNSIKDSAHKLLKDTIERLGLSTWFTVTADSIKSRVGAEFMFKGLHNNENGIRSTEGVDICWVEEAHSVTALSWQSLLPTIRGDESEIWISFNMVEESDATYQMFVANERPHSIVHHINYDSNPFLPKVLRDEMEHDKKTDYALYEHIWLGKPRKRSNAIVLNGKYRIEEFPDDLYEHADRLFFGADWGYAEDPSTLVRCFILNNKLYIEYEAYGKHIELNDYAAFYDQVPGSRDWPIYADSALPATISHVRGLGFAIDAAEKWPGSVEDGIKHLRGYDEIIIHPRCKMAADEAYKWRYKVDKKVLDANMQPLVLPTLVDAHNHCIPAGVLVSTACGDVPIEQVQVGDLVWTRVGLRPVLWAGATDTNREVLEITLSSGHVVRCTPDHEVFVNGEFIRADAAQVSDNMNTLDSTAHGRRIGTASVVSITRIAEKADVVYDVTVDGQHEFFANGVLVHNCWDAVRYALHGYIPRSGEMGVWNRLGAQALGQS